MYLNIKMHKERLMVTSGLIFFRNLISLKKDMLRVIRASGNFIKVVYYFTLTDFHCKILGDENSKINKIKLPNQR